MDPFDEFEFKPLTEGLGFHKKQKSLKESVKEVELEDRVKPSLPSDIPFESAMASSVGENQSKELKFEDIVNSLENSSLELSQPLPREKVTPSFQMTEMEIETPRPTEPVKSPFPTPSDYKKPYTSEVVKKTPRQEELASVGTRRGAADSPQGNLKASPGSLSAAILDLVVVMAIGLIFTSALLSVTGVQLETLVNSANSELMTQISVGILLVAVMQIYFIIARAFFACTLGEWTFDLQLGRDEDYKNENYPLRVIMRSLLVTLTGVVVLPVLSFLVRRDLAGMITGLNLYQQKNS